MRPISRTAPAQGPGPILMQEIYVSTDVEADGPIPGPHSMLSLGSAAFTAAGEMLSTFSANLDLLEGAAGHPATMDWWAKNPEAWLRTRTDLEPPSAALRRYVAWLQGLPGRPVFVGYPAAYDFLFVYWYLIRFTGQSPFSHSALDIKTLRHGAARPPLPRLDQAQHAPPLVLRGPPHPRRPGRRHRAGAAVLQHAGGKESDGGRRRLGAPPHRLDFRHPLSRASASVQNQRSP